MKIIDKYTDYYDHLSKVYGEDNKVVYDRRNSHHIKHMDELASFIFERYKYLHRNLFTLEVGFSQFLFSFEDAEEYTPKGSYSTKIKYSDFRLVKIFNERKHLFEAPISICRVGLKYSTKWYSMIRKQGGVLLETVDLDELNIDKDYIIKNPILKDTDITKKIEPFTIWSEVSNYISSFNNDKDASIVNTDVDKAVNHGFDKRWSFRHPIK